MNVRGGRSLTSQNDLGRREGEGRERVESSGMENSASRSYDESSANKTAISDTDGATKETAKWELAVWTRGFCEYTRKVVDDTLTLSATLMRAGEIEGATLLLADVERDVHDEESVLTEVVRLEEKSGDSPTA